MNVRRALAGCLLALIAFAFSSIALAAPQKQFSIAATPSSTLPNAKQTYTLWIKNEVPSGNSNFNSITLNLPPGFTLDQTSVIVNWPFTPPLQTTATSVSITNMSPVKPQQSFSLTLAATAPSTFTSCVQWTGTAFTGSGLTGDTFIQIPTTLTGKGSAYVGNTSSFTISFGALPTSVLTNPPQTTPYSISVSLTSGCPGISSDGPVTLSAAGGGITGGGTQNTTNGTTTFNVSFLNVGQTTLTASAPGFGTTSVTLNVFGGVLNCNPSPPFTFDGSLPGATINTPGYASGQRGKYNKDGLPCAPVNYTFTNKITAAAATSNDYALLKWDTAAQPNAAFKWTVNWGPVPYDSSTGLPVAQRPNVAWIFNPDGSPANLHPAIACLTDKLPAPYGRLTAFALNNDFGTITVDTATNPPTEGFAPILPTPFPIMVGTERMQVTNVSGSGTATVFTVSRHQADTVAVTPVIGNFVMSTPLPVDTVNAGYLNTVARMCIIEQGFTTYTPNPVTGAPRAFYFTTVIDIGDGYVQGNF